MTRSVWTGSISFGLVNVPVKAYTAVRDHTVHFRQLEKGTGARIHNEEVSGKTGDPVESEDIELGYEVRSGRYVTFEKGELDDLRPASTRAIEVSDFVALADVDPIYYQKTYYLEPEKVGAKPFALLMRALKESGRTSEQALTTLKGANPASAHPGIEATVKLIYAKDSEDEVDGLLKDTFVACLVKVGGADAAK